MADELAGNDRLSEVHVPSGIVAVLYQHSSYSGDKAVIVGESPCLLYLPASIRLPRVTRGHYPPAFDGGHTGRAWLSDKTCASLM